MTNTADTFVSADATAAVHAWITTPSSNNGFMIQANTGTSVQFDSKESTSHPVMLAIVLASNRATDVTGPSGATSTVAGPAGATGATGAASTLAGPTGPTGAASTIAGPAGITGATGPAGSVGLSLKLHLRQHMYSVLVADDSHGGAGVGSYSQTNDTSFTNTTKVIGIAGPMPANISSTSPPSSANPSGPISRSAGVKPFL
jgi:hypothetical protein